MNIYVYCAYLTLCGRYLIALPSSISVFRSAIESRRNSISYIHHLVRSDKHHNKNDNNSESIASNSDETRNGIRDECREMERRSPYTPPHIGRTQFNDINFRRFIIYTLCRHIAFTFNHEPEPRGHTVVMRAGQTGAYTRRQRQKRKTKKNVYRPCAHYILSSTSMFASSINIHFVDLLATASQPHHKHTVRANNNRHDHEDDDRRQYKVNDSEYASDVVRISIGTGKRDAHS